MLAAKINTLFVIAGTSAFHLVLEHLALEYLEKAGPVTLFVVAKLALVAGAVKT